MTSGQEIELIFSYNPGAHTGWLKLSTNLGVTDVRWDWMSAWCMQWSLLATLNCF